MSSYIPPDPSANGQVNPVRRRRVQTIDGDFAVGFHLPSRHSMCSHLSNEATGGDVISVPPPEPMSNARRRRRQEILANQPPAHGVDTSEPDVLPLQQVQAGNVHFSQSRLAMFTFPLIFICHLGVLCVVACLTIRLNSLD